MSLTQAQIRWFRQKRSGLVDPFSSAEQVTARLAGVQAQILPAAALSLWNRTGRLTYAEFEALLYQRRSLVKLWGQRHTLHLYPSREWPLVQAAMVIRQSWWERQLAKNGGDVAAHRALLARIAALLRGRDTMGRGDLRAAEFDLADEFFSAWGGIFADLVKYGYACHARPSGNEGQFAHRENWLPDLVWQPPDSEAANIELARRYFRTYGPATVQDLAYWRGAKVAQARRWAAALQAELTSLELAGQAQLLLQDDLAELNQAPPRSRAWPVRMLYRFDPLLLAHRDKTWLIEPDYYSRVWRPAGHIEGTVLDQGRLVGSWRYDRKGSGLLITVYPFRPFPPRVTQAVEKTSQAIAQFFARPLLDLIVEKR